MRIAPALNLTPNGDDHSPMMEDPMSTSVEHDPARLFRLLERTAGLLARHPDFPGKAEAMSRCRDDIKQRFLQGILTREQRDRLLAILDAENP
jgi:hypothetical protein